MPKSRQHKNLDRFCCVWEFTCCSDSGENRSSVWYLGTKCSSKSQDFLPNSSQTDAEISTEFDVIAACVCLVHHVWQQICSYVLQSSTISFYGKMISDVPANTLASRTSLPLPVQNIIVLQFACCIIVTRWGGPGGIEAWSDEWPSSFSALTLLVGHVTCKNIVPEWPILCRVGR